jgi:hypothetical protein
MGSSSQEDEAARALERGGGIRKMGGGSDSRSRKTVKAVFRKYAFIVGTHVPSGARAYWAGRPAGPCTAAVQLGP